MNTRSAKEATVFSDCNDAVVPPFLFILSYFKVLSLCWQWKQIPIISAHKQSDTAAVTSVFPMTVPSIGTTVECNMMMIDSNWDQLSFREPQRNEMVGS